MPDSASLLGVVAVASALSAFLVALPAESSRWRRRAAGVGFVVAFACLTLADGLLLDMTHLSRQGGDLAEIRPYFVGIGIPLGIAQAWLAIRVASRPDEPKSGSGA